MLLHTGLDECVYIVDVRCAIFFLSRCWIALIECVQITEYRMAFLLFTNTRNPNEYFIRLVELFFGFIYNNNYLQNKSDQHGIICIHYASSFIALCIIVFEAHQHLIYICTFLPENHLRAHTSLCSVVAFTQ